MGKSIYIVALVATIAIILVVYFSVNFAENAKAREFNDQIIQFSLENELQSSFEDFDSNNKTVYCEVIRQGINNLSSRADDFERQLATFKENSFNTKEFASVKRNYLITNMLLFRTFLRARSFCDMNIKPVLFFYAEDRSCDPKCGIIGSQLFELRTCSSFRAFNFPYNWPNYSFTKILEVKYGITSPGVLVIDGNVVDSVLNMPELKNQLGCEGN
ncbi:MAG: hypothetical protein NTY48_05870 [Candidatus Diapherotrites archaeon]|nr:hypothetical protein [Candidatus Diapherotrites archaeon]